MVESAILIAIATVLSLIKIIQLPYGGSVTIAAMLPIIIISYRHGLGWGIASGLVYGVIRQLLGISVLGWVTTWQSILAVILLDYVVAFAFCGLGGVFRRPVKNQALALTLGAILACVLRFLCHVISGATVWAGLSIPTEAALIYSIAYNSTYMIPETIVLTGAAFYIGSSLDLSAEIPVRIRKTGNIRASVLRICGWSVLTAALIADVAIVFSKLQNGESGEWYLSGLSEVNWFAVAVLSVAACLIALIVFYTASKEAKNQT